jgi:protein involved in polysaccharide export with SLBB domain
MAGRDSSIVVALAAVLASAGCAIRRGDTPTVLPTTFVGEKHLTQELPATQIVRRSYRLRRGDQLEIMHHVRHRGNEFSRFNIEDVATIRFPSNPSLNQTEKVRFDGALHLALVGAVPVLDKTVKEVRDDLTRRYSRHTENPLLTVSYKPSEENIAEVTEAIKTAFRGQSRPVTITPDGTISLPFIADIQAADKTLTELRKDLNNAYREVGLEGLTCRRKFLCFRPLPKPEAIFPAGPISARSC